MKRNIILLFLFSTILHQSYSQAVASIVGFSCATPGVPYTYYFNGGWDSTVSIQVCITGGVISGESNNCKTTPGITSVSVTWNDSIITGSIQVSYSGKTITRDVNITPVLSGGTITLVKKTQFVDSTSIPADINCSQSRGGTCNPDYSYQWQASKDILNWKDIPGANNKNLKFSSPVPRAIYLRRRTKENNSGSIAYSDEAVVFIN